MANYYAYARSNYFRVRDLDALRAALAELTITVRAASPTDPTLVTLLCETDDGWPTGRYNPDTDEDDDLDVPDLIASHLTEGSVAVFLEVGWEQPVYLVGWAVAVNHAHQRRQVSLDDIYQSAAALGSHVTRAVY